MKYSKQTSLRGFTLAEVIITMFVLSFVLAATMTAFVTLLKQHKVIESTNTASFQLQMATSQIFRMIQSSPAAPIILNNSGTAVTAAADGTFSGTSVRLAPAMNYYAMVAFGPDTIDAPSGTKGYAKTQNYINFALKVPQASTQWVYTAGSTCPSTNITNISGQGFLTTGDLPNLDVSKLFNVGDKVTLPQTGYGDTIEMTILSIDSTPGSTQKITFTGAFSTALASGTAWNLPEGTLIGNTAGARNRLTIVTTAAGSLKKGDLVYYPDDSDLTVYKILARDVDGQPRTNPTNPAVVTTEAPFIYNPDPSKNDLCVNFQILPVGNPVAGRATTGSRMRIKIRTAADPTKI
jgi:prepilin-type N-terminal cleavage/methylation domain-containing protein